MSILEDPLNGYGGLSLFPLTFPSLPQDYLSDDLLSTHNFLKSLPLRNKDKLLEQAKSILSGGCELPAVGTEEVSQSKEENEAVGGNVIENPRERRPGLGRKRARFSLLPNSSQPSVSLERTLDIDKLKDPEEFFMAFERLENAKKDIAKQTGNIQTGTNQPGAPVASRPRRPGIPGRSRTAKYKHLYPTMQSQESSEAELFSESPGGSQQKPDTIPILEEHNKEGDDSSEEAELTGAVGEAEGRVNKLLDDLGELLSQEGMDEDGAVNLLENRLQIKPLNIGKLNLPESRDVQKIDLKPSRGGKFDKPRHALSDIHNILKEIKSISPRKLKKPETSVLSFGSPTPPKSPFTVVKLVQKLTPQSDPLGDPFAAVDLDSVLEISPSHRGDFSNGGAVNEVNPRIIDEDNHTVTGINSPAVAEFTVLSDRSMEDDMTTIGFGAKIDPNKLCAEVRDKNEGADDKEGIENLQPSGLTKDLEETEPVHSAQPCLIIEEDMPTGCYNQNEHNLNSSKTVEHSEMGGFSKIQSIAPEQDKVKSPERLNEEPAAVNLKEPCKRNTHKRKGCSSKLVTKKQRLKATEGSVAGEFHDAEDIPQLIAPECQKITFQEPSEASGDTQNEPRRRLLKGREIQALSRRKSLAGAGSTYAVDGLRRSTRIRSRPLEYWKGERFLYGRIHESLATVIGIKYESPGKEAGLKVKSYVSDEYKHLVELAALD